MSLEGTESTIRQYVDALLNEGDFASFFADDVVWITMETGDQIRGREAVSDFIIALHSQVFDASPELVSTEFADGVAGLETVFVGTHTAEFAGSWHTVATTSDFMVSGHPTYVGRRCVAARLGRTSCGGPRSSKGTPVATSRPGRRAPSVRRGSPSG